MIVFVNGKIGFGSPPAGEIYWTGNKGKNKKFIEGARRFFNDDKIYFYNKDHKRLSNCRRRFREGYKYAACHFIPFSGIKKHEKIQFVTLSMGAAFAEGMICFLTKKGFDINWVIHINPFQAGELELSPAANRTTVDFQYTNDPVINNRILKKAGIACPGKITGADYCIHLPSQIKNPLKIHRNPIWLLADNFWELVKTELKNNKLQIEV